MSRVLVALLAAAGLLGCAVSSGDQSPETDKPAIGEEGGMCGGIAGFQCKVEKQYCKTAPGACYRTVDVAGVCTVEPEICTMDYRPVCGCDGETYSNACTAAGSGVSVAYEGECQAEG